MTFGGRVLRCAAVAAGLWFAPAVASAAPVDTVPTDTVPADTVPVDTVPSLPEGCAVLEADVVCVGPPPVPYEVVGEPTALAPSPEAVAVPMRVTDTAVTVGVAPETADAAPMVASEAPVPAVAPAAGVVTLSRVATRSVAADAVAVPAPVVPAPGEVSVVPTVALALLLGAVVALAGVTGFRRARVRS